MKNKINIAILIGRAGSKGLPGKNIKKLLGRYLVEYPLIAAKKSKMIKKIFVSTDSNKIKKIAKKYNAINFERPKHLATSAALGEDVFKYTYFQAKSYLEKLDLKINTVTLLFANAATVNSKLIEKGINILNKNSYFDSAVTTSVYNMWSPVRARRKNSKNCLMPYLPMKVISNPKFNCDRDSQGKIYFADMGASIVRPKCLENMKNGLPPQKWMGKKIASIESENGCDIDYEWQVPSVEFWLKKNGYKKFNK